ncbi:hypothetical protein SeLEV6574_g02259 [Synchytrium endobioticum]|uniref:Kinesin-like protein n=1 Tax=Synchytrium endobioticum TaxID=286115 RepID=A0A507D940_9FUNG|nr:hypothetical protein SeLEV6574_g02259 [Synchytrium endobioticum]
MADNIKVICRFRPQNGREIKEGGVPVVSFDDEYTEVKIDSREYAGQFAYDRVFDWNHTQKQVFEYSAHQTVADVMKGYNGTIFTYGQTGAGKTFTMMGDMQNDDLKGMTPRIVESVFNTILQAPSTLEFTVKVSFMEIYMEKIRDLLNQKNRGVYVKGLLEVFVASVAEVYQVMQQGMMSRVVASTGMNSESSRSHSIFRLQISQRNLADGSAKTGKLYLVDLAGSEQVKKSGATGQTLEEAKKINKSLSSLGVVINALTDPKAQHIPYRDSKLTRILQESLGGNSRTTLIINCSPSSLNESETLSTLRFGMRAKSIKNKAKINVELSPTELKVFLRKANADIVILRNFAHLLEGELNVWRSGGSVAQNEWATAEKTGVHSDLFKKVDDTMSDTASMPSPTKSESGSTLSNAYSSNPTFNTLATNFLLSPLSNDERDEFLQRENDLTDQIAEKETELKSSKILVASLQEELSFLKSREADVAKENQELLTSLNEVKLQVEKVTFEQRESGILMDSMTEKNDDLSRQVEDLKTQKLKKQNDEEQSWEAKKQEKIAQMMAEFGPDKLTEKEREMRASLSKIVKGASASHFVPLTFSALTTAPTEEEFESESETRLKSQSSQQEILVENLTKQYKASEDEIRSLRLSKDELESRYATLDAEYEQLLRRVQANADSSLRKSEEELSTALNDLKAKLETQYHVNTAELERQVHQLNETVVKKDAEINALNKTISQISTTEEEVAKFQKQMTDWDTMKTKLMIDLENRCQKVVELEISLDEVREQYNVLMRNSNQKQHQQKMAFLERNLEYLTDVQKQLVEQNSNLKKELVVAERKLAARNDRIENLEHLVTDTQSKLEMQSSKFESELAAMRERLQEARITATAPANTSWTYSAKIAKPLRGGGGVPIASASSDGLRTSSSDQLLGNLSKLSA